MGLDAAEIGAALVDGRHALHSVDRCGVTYDPIGHAGDGGEAKGGGAAVESRVLYAVRTAKGHELRVVLGDLTRARVDCLVNPANGHLHHAGGAALAIATAAGEAFVAECSALIAARGSLQPGDACATGAGELAAIGVRCVVHAVGPSFERGAPAKPQEAMLARAARAALDQAARRGVRSVAMPPISLGIFRNGQLIAKRTKQSPSRPSSHQSATRRPSRPPDCALPERAHPRRSRGAGDGSRRRGALRPADLKRSRSHQRTV